MQRKTIIVAGLGVLIAAAPAAARARPPGAPPLPIVYDLPRPAVTDERSRWSLPELRDAHEEPRRPRLRLHGTKVKLRVPIG